MKNEQIKQLIENRIREDGMVETGIEGIQLFRGTKAFPCTPAVYNPTVIAIVNGAKEAKLDGQSYIYDSGKYMCCTTSMPMEVGTAEASPDNPLLGVVISLDRKIMTDMVIETDNSTSAIHKPGNGPLPLGMTLAHWDDRFSNALLQLLELGDNPADMAVLGESRLREVYYAILKGDAGDSVRRSFGVGNEIARMIDHLSLHLNEVFTIEDMASKIDMSRAVFHRKFKQATTMSPIQFVKALRLNSAAMMMAGGMHVNEAAAEVGYISPSQFSREFKRMYGQSPKQWSCQVQ